MKIKDELKRLNLSNPAHFCAVGFGSGLIPVAPGTFGTLAGLPLYWLSHSVAWPIYLLLLAIGFVLGLSFCESATKAIGVEDHGGIVWDEIIGIGVAMIAIPCGWDWLLAAFILFRLFDILKPWPIGWADQKVSGGLGIMLDDLLAGLMALAVLQLLAMGLN